MAEKYARWDAAELLIHHPEDIGPYLDACIDEDPGDGSVIRAALNNVARARNMSGLARDAGLDRSGVYKALSQDARPQFETILKIIRALGLRFRIEVVDQRDN